MNIPRQRNNNSFLFVCSIILYNKTLDFEIDELNNNINIKYKVMINRD